MAQRFIVTLTVLSIIAASQVGRPEVAVPVEAGFPVTCEVDRVLDGDTFTCLGGPTVQMLQIDAPEVGDCGGAWATIALSTIFLKTGTRVRLEYDTVRGDRYGPELAAPIVKVSDGHDYNISIMMAYVGLARAAFDGTNSRYLDWAKASEAWAQAAGWNMWAAGGPFNGGLECGEEG